jgi:hypothetical protein
MGIDATSATSAKISGEMFLVLSIEAECFSKALSFILSSDNERKGRVRGLREIHQKPNA